MPRIMFQGFGDIAFSASDDASEPATFGLGQIGLFATGAIADRISLLAEAVIEAEGDNAFHVELERLHLQFLINDNLRLSAGRFHTGIGYYNTAFHHGKWMAPTTERPFIFEFEEDGGILPIHEVGLSATGQIPSGVVGLHYLAEVGNGRSWRTSQVEPVQTRNDENSRKSINLGVFARPRDVPALQVGMSYYRDRLAVESSADVHQSITAAYANYETGEVHLLGEFLLLRQQADGGPAYTNPAFYVQVARRFGDSRPYFRYEYLDVDANTPLIGDTGRRQGPVMGVGWAPWASAVLKIEFQRVGGRVGTPVNTLTTQAAFRF